MLILKLDVKKKGKKLFFKKLKMKMILSFLKGQEVCSNPQFKSLGQYLYKTVTSLLAYNGEALNEIGEAINAVITPEYAQEIQGCAAAMDVPYGWVTLFNLGYEVSDACTSIVAQTNDGKILHARNLDFWAGMGFTNTLKNMSFIVSGQSNFFFEN